MLVAAIFLPGVKRWLVRSLSFKQLAGAVKCFHRLRSDRSVALMSRSRSPPST
jgi:hypothetical protein